jgi:AcrR family transcriptional regulator
VVGRGVNAVFTRAHDAPRAYTLRQLEVLGAATRVFSEHGYRAGTIAQIASAAGLSQAGLLHHFPSKDAMLMAVIALRRQENLELFSAEVDQGTMVVDAIMSVMRANARKPELMRLFAVLSTEALNRDHPAHQFFIGFYALQLSDIAEATVLDQAAGLVRDDIDAHEIARLILASADGARYQSLLGDRPTEQWRTLLPLRTMLAGPACGPLPEWAVEAPT